MKEINIIDCTLRDGGYYNNWDFSNEIVNDYLESMSRIGVKNIELGFRSLQKRDWQTVNNKSNKTSMLTPRDYISLYLLVIGFTVVSVNFLYRLYF